MGCELIDEMDRAGLNACAQHVFFILREKVRCSRDGRAAASLRYMADRVERSDKAVRYALKTLVDLGWIKTDTKSRAYIMVTLLRHRQVDAAKDAVIDAIKKPITQYEFNMLDAEKDAEKDATGVTAVRRSLGVCSSPGSLESERVAAQKQRAAELQGRAGRLMDKPDKRFTGFTQAKRHMVTKWSAAHQGVKMPSTVGDWVQFQSMCKQRPPAAIAALWETFLRETDTFWVNKGFTIRMFHSRLSALITNDRTYLRRAAELERSWFGEIKSLELMPHAKKQECRAIIAEVELDYDPAEVRFSADVRARIIAQRQKQADEAEARLFAAAGASKGR